MISVAQQISNLLFAHECVIIPSLGAFVSTTVSAQFDEDKNVFLPPSKEIGFNRSLSHNDGLLISTLAQENKISYGKAKIMVEQFITDLLDELKQGHHFNIEKVGTLKQDALGYMQFVADKSEAYLMDAFGLSSFHFEPVIKPRALTADNREVRRLLQPVSLKQIAASVAVLVGLFAVSQKLDNPMLDKHIDSASAIMFAKPNTPYVANEATLTVEASEIAEANVVEVEVEEKRSYYLIAGSFKKESQAERFLSIIQEMGEDQAFVLASPNKRFRVAISGFVDKTSAIDQLNIYRKKEDFKTVWILTQH